MAFVTAKCENLSTLYNMDHVKSAIDANHPVLASLPTDQVDPVTDKVIYHEVTITDYNENTVTYYDPQTDMFKYNVDYSEAKFENVWEIGGVKPL
jgi:uncharacterized protein YvpB